MKMLLVGLFFAIFSFWWPVFVCQRSRGMFALIVMAAPWLTFWWGWFAR